MGIIAVGVVVVVVAALAMWAVGIYNRLVGLRNKADEAWAGIDVQLQRRADLVPNLVETVRGYQIHEQELLREVTEARAGLLDAGGPREAGQADGFLENVLGRLFAVAEDYPELQASDNFQELQEDLTEIEEEVAFARRFYNATVEDLSTAIQRFPNVLIARPLGFGEREYFRAEEPGRAVPEVDFGSRP